MLVAGRTSRSWAGAAELRDRTLFPAFDMADVKQVRMAAGDKRLAVERSGDGVEGRRAGAREHQGRPRGRYAPGPARRKWKEIAAKGPEDAAKWGLDKPEAELTLFKDGGAELATLQVGRTDGAVTYVKLRAEPGIYAVSSKDLDDLRKARAEIPS